MGLSVLRIKPVQSALAVRGEAQELRVETVKREPVAAAPGRTEFAIFGILEHCTVSTGME